MKIVSWNVNSVRARIQNILDYIKQSAPDILIIIPPLIIEKDQIEYFIKATESILNQGFLKLFKKFIIDNIIK